MGSSLLTKLNEKLILNALATVLEKASRIFLPSSGPKPNRDRL